MRNAVRKSKVSARRCGLCGKRARLTKTECCGQWICNDEHEYVLFSYVRNSCHRNHRRYTLCGYHYAEEHEGDWKDCSRCHESFETEMYVWYGTNEYNFEKLPNPPSFAPTKCSKCGADIKLSTDGYARKGDEYWCESCSDRELEKLTRPTGLSGKPRMKGAGLRQKPCRTRS